MQKGGTLSTTTRGRLLSSTFQLRDIEDVEGLCRNVLSTYCGRTQTTLRADDRADAISYLIALCWELERGYDESRLQFSLYARQILALRVTDWFRSVYGRSKWQFAGHTYERDTRPALSLDGPAGDHTGDARGTLGATLANVDRNLEADRDPPLGGLLAHEHRERDRDLNLLREVAARRVSERAHERNLRKSPKAA